MSISSFQRASNFLKKSSSETIALIQDMISTRSFQQALLKQAKLGNAVSKKTLFLQKEVNLVRYYGVSRYIQEKWPASSVPGAINWTSRYNEDLPAQKKAKVAFMVTSTMKQELNEELGYSEADIKALTPLQASLILNHKVKVEEKDEKLPQLEEDYRLQEDKEAEELKRKIEEEAQAQASKDKSILADAVQPRDERNTLLSGDTRMFPENAKEWFEVVELNSKDGDEQVVALYQSRDEAEFGRETQELFAERRAKDRGLGTTTFTYSIRSTIK